jgi:hypothetical protein
MTKNATMAAFALITIHLGCTSVGESVGRRVDPKYDNYIENRTIYQEESDRKLKEQIERERIAKQKSDESMKSFDSLVDEKSRQGLQN